MEGLLIIFPKCVFFVDWKKNKRWRPKKAEEQERAYDGYKKSDVWSIIVYCDLFGSFIRLKISDKSAENDSIYTNHLMCISTLSTSCVGLRIAWKTGGLVGMG